MRSGRRRGVGNQEESELRERVARLERENARLAGSEERLKILFEDAPDGYYLSDLKGAFVDGNSAAEQITGYRRDELIGKSFLSLKLLSSADVLRAASLLAKNLLGHSTGPDEFALTRKDGSTVPVEIRTHPVRIGGRRLVLGIARDISARKRTERDLRQRAKELRALFGLSEIAERQGISLDEVCEALADILPGSWQHEEIACARIVIEGREFRTAHFADTPWRQSAPVRVGGATVGTIEVGYLEARPDEDEGPFLKRERQLLDALAEQLGRIAERKQTKQALRLSEERYHTLFNEMDDGVALADAETGTLLDCNAAMCRMVERDREELLGQPQSVLHPPKQLVGGMTRSFREPAAGRAARSVAEDLISRTGRLIPVEIRTARVEIEGRHCLLGIFRDVTERRRTEKALERSHSLLSQSQEIAHVGSWELDVDEDRLAWSDEVYRIFGLPPQATAATYGAFLNAIHPDDREAVDAAYRGSLRDGRDAYSTEHRVIRPLTGEVRYVQEKCVHERTAEGRVTRSIGIVQDVTDRKTADLYRNLSGEILAILNEPAPLQDSIERVLAAVKARTGIDAVGMRLRDGHDFPYFAQQGFSSDFLLTENTLIERGANGLVCRDRDGNVNLVCTCGLVISGRTDPSNPLFTPGGSAWTNDSLLLLEVPLDKDPRYHPRNTCIHKDYASVALVPIRTRDEIVGLIQLNDRRKDFFSLAVVEQLEGIAAHVGEALVRKQFEEDLARMARHDPLTGVLNRYALDELLEREATRSKRYTRPIGLLMIDVNRFKEINDRFGHGTGDKVLQAVAAVIQQSIRESDILVRYGGDEFLVVLPETSEETDHAKDRILAEVARRNTTNALLDFPVTLAIGTYHWSPGSGQTIDQALAEADRRMYEDKRRGAASSA